MITLTATLERTAAAKAVQPVEFTDEQLADLKADIIEVVNGRGWLIDITVHCGNCPHPPHQDQCGITISTRIDDVELVSHTCKCTGLLS